MTDLLTANFADHWVVDPVAGLAGVADVSIVAGKIASVTWRDGEVAARACWAAGANPGAGDPTVALLPALIDLHAHFRQPGANASEEVESGTRAAAHGGYGIVALMPNTEPAADNVETLQAAIAGERHSVRLLPIAAATVGRAGTQVSDVAALVKAGAVAISDDGSPIADRAIFRAALLAAAAAGIPLIEHCEEPTLTAGGEAADGIVASRLGLRPWPAAGELRAVESAIAVLRDVVSSVPTARLHLTHLSTTAALAAVRSAQGEGLPLTCDVTPHHIALIDAWIAGDRRWAWEVASGDERLAPTADAFDSNLRVCPPLRAAGDAAACREALRNGTALAIGTDHAPHSREKKEVEFGLAANGIAGIETSLSVALAAHHAGELSLATIAAALTTGPARLLGVATAGLTPGAAASLVQVDLAGVWRPSRATLLGRSINTPLIDRELPGVVQLTVLEGRPAYQR
ncbi:MAG: dihydroorotase [Candidatus Aquidulcis sp.]|nr:MAG: dihydroorotase [Candidatus Aquidulcis sp.]